MRRAVGAAAATLSLMAMALMGGCPAGDQALVAGTSTEAAIQSDLTGKVLPGGSDAAVDEPAASSEANTNGESAAVQAPPLEPPTDTQPAEPVPDASRPGNNDAEPRLPSAPSPFGTWVLESGAMLPTFVKGLATFDTTTDVTAMILNENGAGRVFLRDRLTGAKDAVRAFALFDGDTLVFDFAAETTSDFVFNLAIEDDTFFFPVVVVDDDTLGIADENGRVALFTRRTHLPPDVTLGMLEVIDEFQVPAPQFFTDMTLLDGDLVYAGSSEIQSFDLETDTMAAPLGPVSSRLVQTAQGGFLWTHCGCGGSRDAFKRTLSTVVDTVSSEDEMGGPITFRAMAYVPTTDRLWLHGRPFDSQFGQFFIVNTNGEPDVVEQTISFNRDLRALAFDGTDLWGVVTVASQSVVRIDATTGAVLETFDVPNEDVSWNGLEFDAANMYMLGTDLNGDGVLLRLARP